MPQPEGVEADIALTVAATSTPSVFTVEWTGTTVSEGRIEYGIGDAFDHEVVATTTDGLTHTAMLAGLGAGETWSLRVVSTEGGSEQVVGTATIDIPAAPSRVTPALVEDDASDRGGFTLVTLPSPGDNYVAILDRAGRPTWWYHYEGSGTVLDARMTVDGTAVDLLSSGVDSTFVRVGLDGEVQIEAASVIDAHHGFAPLPDGGYLVLAHESVQVGEVLVLGDRLVELDSEFNEVRRVWSVFDSFQAHPNEFLPDDTWDWSHANSVNYDAATGKALVSLYGLDAIVQIDVESGAADWTLGGDHSDYALPTDAAFDEQHAALAHDGGVLVFDNGGIPESGLLDAKSTLRLFSLDGTEAVQTASWTEPDEIYVATLGNAEPDADGVLTVGWGSAGRMTEMVLDGGSFSKQRDVEMPLGSPFGYVHPVAELAGARR